MRYLKFLLLGILLLVNCQETLDLPDYHLMADPSDRGTGPAPGIGSTHVAIFPSSWKFRFLNGPHHIKDISLETYIDDWNPNLEWINWKTVAKFNDKNRDDPFRFNVIYTIVTIPNSYMHYGQAPIRRESSGGPHSYNESFTSDDLKGFAEAKVVLVGWRFGFWGEDHHLKRIGITIGDSNYNAEEGKIEWTVNSVFADKNEDDDYYWSYQWLVIAVKSGSGTFASSQSLTYDHSDPGLYNLWYEGDLTPLTCNGVLRNEWLYPPLVFSPYYLGDAFGEEREVSCEDDHVKCYNWSAILPKGWEFWCTDLLNHQYTDFDTHIGLFELSIAEMSLFNLRHNEYYSHNRGAQLFKDSLRIAKCRFTDKFHFLDRGAGLDITNSMLPYLKINYSAVFFNEDQAGAGGVRHNYPFCDPEWGGYVNRQGWTVVADGRDLYDSFWWISNNDGIFSREFSAYTPW